MWLGLGDRVKIRNLAHRDDDKLYGGRLGTVVELSERDPSQLVVQLDGHPHRVWFKHDDCELILRAPSWGRRTT